MHGIFPAVLTPFAADGSLDLDCFVRHLDRLYTAGVDGVYVGGNAGEWHALSLGERMTLAETAIAASRGRGKVAVHIGSNRLQDSLELARHAARAGADAVSSLPPYASRWSMPEVKCWFELLSTATDLPFFIYYFPTLTGGAAGEDFFQAMRPVPSIAGYKFTDANLADLGILLEQGLTILNGHDPNLKQALLLGAKGGIGAFYNILPKQVVAIARGCRSAAGGDDLAGAEEQQTVVNRAIGIVRRYRIFPALKFLAGMGVMRAPMLPLTAAEQAQLRGELEGVLG